MEQSRLNSIGLSPEKIKNIVLIKNFRSAGDDAQFTENEVAIIIGIPLKYMHEARGRGYGIKFYALGPEIYYKKLDINKWCARHPKFRDGRYYTENF